MPEHESSSSIELLAQCTVLIANAGSMGTGFFVAPGLVLTCAHVPGERSAQKQKVSLTPWEGEPSEGVLEQILPDPLPDQDVYPDIALISTSLRNLPCVLLDPRFDLNDRLLSFGYSKLAFGGEAFSAVCEFIRDHSSSPGGTPERRLIKFKMTEVLPGMSGSPLMNEKTRGVCGIVKRSRNENTDAGGTAVRIALVLQLFPEIAKLNKQFHDKNTQWQRAIDYLSRNPKIERAGTAFFQMTMEARNEALSESASLKPPDLIEADWQLNWRPQHLVENVQFEDEASPAELKMGTPVIVTFEAKLSKSWQDPKLKTVAMWDAKTSKARPVPSHLWRNLKRKKTTDRGSHAWERPPLCIPSYQVPVEWRLESYVFTNPWGPAKEKVVRHFLDLCRGKYLECRVLSLQQPVAGAWVLLVQSADYDALLQMEWPYYKGLESGVSRGRFYKSKAVVGLNPTGIKELVERSIASDPHFRALIPARYSERFKQRSIESSDVLLMLTGIIEREKNAIDKNRERNLSKHQA